MNLFRSPRRLAVLLMTTWWAGAAGVHGFHKPPHDPLPNFDRRGREARDQRLPEGRVRAADRLRDRMPGLRIDFDDRTGSPKFIAAREGFLTGPNGEGRAIPATAAQAVPAGDPHRAIKAFLNEHAGLFEHNAQALTTARLKRDFATGHNGLRTVIWQQELDGLPVYEAVLAGHITRQGELVNLSSQFLPDPEAAANAGAPGRAGRLAAPRVGPADAVRLAAAAVGEELQLAGLAAVEEKPVGPEKRQAFRAPPLPGSAQVRLVWLPLDRATLRLCWQVELTRRAGGERYRVLVDADNGEALLRRCLTVYLRDAAYRVFPSDSPSPFSPAYPAPTTNQPPLVPRSLVTLGALSTNASPLGWINDNDNETRGNNVDAHSDLDADDLPDLPRPQGAPFRVFDFPLDLGQGPETYTDAAVVQLFYWCNWMHDRLYELGFTEAAGNFQKDNFGRGGLGSDAVLADAQDGSGVNNANFTPTEDGTPPRIQMYRFTGPTPHRDGDLDAEIILHEYTHGLSDRLVGGGVGISQLQSAGLGEGWSDFYALALLSEPADDLDGTYPAGAYASHLFYGLTENYYFGIRRYPYCTDLAKNPLTFKDIDPNQASPHAGVPMNPLWGFNPADAAEVHNQGEVWCALLWDARAALIRRHGFAVGNELILQLVTDGMKLSPPNPDFVQARDAILQADVINNGGANWTALWMAFARRGLGFNAASPGSFTTSGIVEAQDLPDALLIAPMTPFISSGPVGGPLAPPCQVYQLTNHSTRALTWTASVSQPWLSVTPAGGTLAGNTGTQLSICVTPGAAALPLGSYTDTLVFSNLTSGVVQRRDAHLRLLQFAALPFSEDFESGELRLPWMLTGLGDYRARVTDVNGPAGGSYHLTMDSTESGAYGRNELTLGLDLGGYTNVVLRFAAKSFGDEPDPPPSNPFIEGANFDGVAVSDDGVRWFEVKGLRQLTGTYALQTVNLDDFITAFGLAYNASFRVRFNQYDNFQIPFDGLGLDDISITGVPARRLFLSVPATAVEGAGVLVNQGRLSLAMPATSNIVVTLASAAPGRVAVPATVVLPAGATQALFNLTILDNGVLDGTQPARLTASALNYHGPSATIEIQDNEAGTLRVKLPPRAREGDGLLDKEGTVMVSPKVAADVAVQLQSGEPSVLRVPARVVIPTGKNSASFLIGVVDNHKIDGSRPVTVTARVDNWRDGSDTILVLDNDTPGLSVRLPAQTSEGNGLLPGAGTVTLIATLPTNLTVALSSGDLTELRVPASVVVPAGRFTATFDLTVVDDADVDGPQTVTVTAQAPGVGLARATMTVLDDETPPVPYQPQPPDFASDVSVSTGLAWRGGVGEIVVNGGFETGDFTGWRQDNADYGTYVVNDGQLDPEGPDEPMPPFEGGYCALSTQIGGGQHTLYQDVFLPADSRSATFSWVDRIRNHATRYAVDEQEFRVEIRSTADQLLALAFTTNPGDPLTNNWTRRSFDLTPFRGRTVRLAFMEEDRLGYFNVSIDNVRVVLGDAADAPTYDVYFGAGTPQAMTLLGRTTNAAWTLPRLELETPYYWQVVSRRGPAQTRGPVWTFTTRGLGTVERFAWAPIASPQTVDQPFAVRLTALDAEDNVVTNFQGAVRLSGQAGPENASVVVITEVDAGNQRRVEFANVSGRQLDLTGWQIVLYDGRSWPAPRTVFVVPTNTLCGPEDLFLLNVAGQAPTPYPVFSAQTNVFWNSAIPLSNQIAVLLRDAGGEVVDLFCAVGADPAQITLPAPVPAGAWRGNPVALTTNRLWTYQRLGDRDRNNSNDWFAAEGTIGWLAGAFAQPFPNPAPVPVSPAVVSNFTAGVWTGPLTLGDVADQVILQVIDDAGHFGRSTPLAVRAGNDLSLSLSDRPQLVIIGDDLTYTLMVSNAGPEAAASVTLTDPLPVGARFGSVSASQGACQLVGDVVFCALGELAAGAAANVTLVVTAELAGPLTNTARVARGGLEGFPGNDAATTVSTVSYPAVFLPTGSGANVRVTERDTEPTNALFPVQLSAPCRLPVSVGLITADATALAGLDYVATTGRVDFAPGITNAVIPVPVLGDLLDENIEYFYVNLVDATNATILLGQNRCLISDNDPAPRVSIGDTVVREGPPGRLTDAEFVVWLSAPSALGISLTYVAASGSATAGRDFVPKSGILEFTPGVTNRTVRVAVRGDTAYETNETFSVSLGSPANVTIARGTGFATILDNGVLELDHFDLAPVASPQSAGAPFPVAISARDGRGEVFPGFTGTVSLRAVARSTEHRVGQATNLWAYPMSASFYDARTQVIYPAAELPGPGVLTALALDVGTVPGQTLSNWTLRLKHTPLAAYSRAAWETEGWTTVYQRAEPVYEPGWVTFYFDTPFAYDGTNSLMVDLSHHNGSYSSDGLCRATPTAEARALTFRTDGAFGDPLAWSGTNNPPPALARLAPNLRLLVETTVPVEPAVSGNFIDGEWTGALVVLAPATNVFLRVLDHEGHAGAGNSFAVVPAPGAVARAPEPAGRVRLTGARMTPAGVVVTFQSAAGQRYRLERAAQLRGQPWTIVADNVAGTGESVTVLDPSGSTQPTGFYRLRVLSD